MPRKPRQFIEGGLYHVYCRTSRGDPIFLDDVEAEGFVTLVREVKERDGLVIYAWVLMSNHYHLALRTAEIPLWRSMASIQGRTAKAFNARNKVYGPLWQGRYKAAAIEDQRYFDQLAVYIHMNPVAAGLVDDPAKHRWSGHREIVGLDDLGLVDVDEALACFGPTRGRARRSYTRRLRADRETEWVGERPGRLPWWGPARADDEEEISPQRESVWVDYLGRSTAPERPRLDAASFLEHASAALGVGMDLLADRGKTTEVRELRELVAVLGVERYGQQVNALAAGLAKNPGSVSRWVSAGAARRTSDGNFAERLEKLDRRILGAAGYEGEGEHC